MSIKPDAIILLHGIGDQKQKDTLDEFSGALAQLGLASPTSTHILHTHAGPDGKKDFAYFVDEKTINGKPAIVAEMYWSDMSPLETGFMSTLRNFFQLIADAPDIVYASLSPSTVNGVTQDYFIFRILRSALAFSFWLIFYPIIAVNIVWAILVAGFALYAQAADASMSADQILAAPAALTLLYTSFTGILLSAAVLRFFSASRYLRVLTIMVISLLSLVFIFCILGITFRQFSFSYQLTTNYLRAIIDVIWAIPMIVSATFVFLMPVLLFLFDKRRNALLLAFATTYILIRFWLLLLFTLWIIYLTNALNKELYTKLLDKITSALQLLSIVWLDFLVLTVVFGVTFILHVRAKTAARKGADVRYSRLIIPAALPAVCMLMSGLWVAAYLLCVCDRVGSGCANYAICGWMDSATKSILITATLLLLLGGVLLNFVRSGFDIAGDIVNYFKSDGGHRLPNPFAAIWTAYNYKPYKDNSLSFALRKRLRAMCENLDAQYGPFQSVTFAGHSLGSMIAIDMLRNNPPPLRGAAINLATFGSPYRNIFNHYFPHLFPELTRADMPAVSRWMNVYRADDYVGTRITAENCEEGFVEEVKTSPRGHIGYFKDDKEDVAALKQWFAAPAGQTSAAP